MHAYAFVRARKLMESLGKFKANLKLHLTLQFLQGTIYTVFPHVLFIYLFIYN